MVSVAGPFYLFEGDALAASNAVAQATVNPRRVRRGEDGFNAISNGAPQARRIDTPGAMGASTRRRGGGARTSYGKADRVGFAAPRLMLVVLHY